MMIHEWAIKHDLSQQAFAELSAILSCDSHMINEPSEMSEAAIQQRCRLAGPELGALLLRNNSGCLPDATGRYVRFGLGNDSPAVNENIKSSDLIGVTVKYATHVGQKFGVFTACEVKDAKWKLLPSDKRGHAQQKFMNIIKTWGGIAGFVKSTNDLKELLK